MEAGGDEARNVRHVHEQIGTHAVGDLAHALEIDDARVGGRAGGDHARLHLEGHFGEGVVIDALVHLADAVMGDGIEATGEIGLVAMGEMAAVGKIHGEDLVARLEHGKIDGGIGLRAGVRLHIHVITAEEFLRAVDGQLLDDVHILATAYLFVRQEPCASMTARLVKFSLAMSSMFSNWRSSSFWIAL